MSLLGVLFAVVLFSICIIASTLCLDYCTSLGREREEAVMRREQTEEISLLTVIPASSLQTNPLTHL
jgi:hypothetical protein